MFGFNKINKIKKIDVSKTEITSRGKFFLKWLQDEIEEEKRTGIEKYPNESYKDIFERFNKYYSSFAAEFRH
jgi:hypothetical protein